ncbi:MAG: type II toxin-antitoxin system Phd/YefM family antitoxin [Phycisphaerae bacterium]|nr:type II toxin-antitoxin system Phd/YefM family antitoxin [Phycisphaerae bacterium]MBN8596907.1 type II toxin-antitoxin system Phd/YefM family antitoxin [Planctomycetota bacterium]
MAASRTRSPKSRTSAPGRSKDATVTVARARARFADTIDLVRSTGQRIVLSKSGKRAAAIISIEDLELLQRLEDAYDLKAARAALKEPGATPWDDVKKRLGL